MNAEKSSSEDTRRILKDISKQIRSLMKSLAPATKVRIDKCLPINNRYADCPALRIRGIDLPYAELLVAVENMAKNVGYPYCDAGWNDATVEGRIDELSFGLYKARPVYWRSAKRQARIITCMKEFALASEALLSPLVESVQQQVKMLKNHRHSIAVSLDVDRRMRAPIVCFSFDWQGLKLPEKDQRRFASQLNDAVYKFFSDDSITDIKCDYGYKEQIFTANMLVLRNRKQSPRHPYFVLLEEKERLLNVRR